MGACGRAKKIKDPKVWASEWSVYHGHYHANVQNQADIFCGALGAFFDVSSNFPVTLSNQLHPNAFNCHALASLQIAHCMQADPIGRIVFFWTCEIRRHPRATKKHWKLSLTKRRRVSDADVDYATQRSPSVPSWEWRLMDSDMFAQVESVSGQLRILGRRVTIPKLESLRMELSVARLLGCYRNTT